MGMALALAMVLKSWRSAPNRTWIWSEPYLTAAADRKSAMMACGEATGQLLVSNTRGEKPRTACMLPLTQITVMAL